MSIEFEKPVASADVSSKWGVSERILPRKLGLYRSGGKRVLDCLLVLLVLPVALPLILACALAVALDGKSPFYWQSRIGRNGFRFSILKIRTMVPDADKVLDAYLEANPDARREWDHKQKLCNDPRVTPVGLILRKTSLDELPQLWNVLKGEMSLVGPRPMMVDQQSLYPGLTYYRLRPGITGPWQVSERHDSGFRERARFDSEYYRNLSLKADIALLFRTVGVVFRGTGC